MNKPIVVVGGGGHAGVVIDALRLRGEKVLGVVDPGLVPGGFVLDVPILGSDEAVLAYEFNSILLANGIGSTGKTDRRQTIYEHFVSAGYRFTNVIHPSATVAVNLREQRGIQIMAGAVVQVGTVLGANVLINTRASVDHDCRVADHVHIAPGATVCGHVTIESGAFVGAGATLIPGVRIGAHGLVGAGSVVLHDVEPESAVAGVPARVIRG